MVQGLPSSPAVLWLHRPPPWCKGLRSLPVNALPAQANSLGKRKWVCNDCTDSKRVKASAGADAAAEDGRPKRAIKAQGKAKPTGGDEARKRVC
jgi:hypothetical protein